MKFSIVSALLLFASSTLADTKYFSYPFQGDTFVPGQTVTFVASDINNDKDVQLTITLNDDRGNYLQDLGQFRGDQADEDAFVFTWVASAPPGNYYVEILQHETDNDNDDDGEEEEEEDDDDDKLRSYIFTITNQGSQAPSYGQYNQGAPQHAPPTNGYSRYSQPPVAPAPASSQPGMSYGGQGIDYTVSPYLPLMNNVNLQSEEKPVEKASKGEKKAEKQDAVKAQSVEAKKYRRRSVLQKRSRL
ncbi:hypothetical protein K501DRAFT_265648 [Backusella circina FSU 941]|nr:hypothetical protein K501DRAFT_265648 [Backusella circina FSU 941]